MIQTIELQTRLTNNFTQIKKTTPVLVQFAICIVNDEVQNMIIMRDDVQMRFYSHR